MECDLSKNNVQKENGTRLVAEGNNSNGKEAGDEILFKANLK